MFSTSSSSAHSAQVSVYPIGQFEVHHYSAQVPDKSVQNVRGLMTVKRERHVVAGGVGFINEKSTFQTYDIAEHHPEAKSAILGLDGVFVRAFVYENVPYVLPYRPTTLTEAKVGDSKHFETYLTHAGIKLSELESGWCYYFQIVDSSLSIGSNLPISASVVVYYRRQRMVDETGKFIYSLSNFKYDITDRKLNANVSTLSFDDVKTLMNCDEKNIQPLPKIIYPVDLTIERANYMLNHDEAVLLQTETGLLKIINVGYDTRKSFRTPGQIAKSCANILQAVIKENTSYVYNGKTIPTSSETKVADAIEMCKYIYPKQYHREIVMLHIILEHIRAKMTTAIMNDYMNNRWRNNPRVQQICNQAFGYAKRMNNQNPATLQQIQVNVEFLIAKENYPSLLRLNDYYKIEKIGF